MSYLQDRKTKKNKYIKIGICVVVLLFLFFFRSGIFSGLSYASHGFFRPVLVWGNNLGEKFRGFGSYFASKNSLYLQNQSLQSKLSEDEARMANYNSIAADNDSLKEILGRKDVKIPAVLAAILAKPDQSAYDTLIIDAGTKQDLKMGDTVFALGNVPIGRIADIFPNSSKVILFSNPGEKMQAAISGQNIFLEIIGRGGGNFEMVVPRNFTLQKGDQATMPGINPYVLAIVETIISDPRDPFVKALLSSPVNIQELKFVEVVIQK